MTKKKAKKARVSKEPPVSAIADAVSPRGALRLFPPAKLLPKSLEQHVLSFGDSEDLGQLLQTSRDTNSAVCDYLKIATRLDGLVLKDAEHSVAAAAVKHCRMLKVLELSRDMSLLDTQSKLDAEYWLTTMIERNASTLTELRFPRDCVLLSRPAAQCLVAAGKLQKLSPLHKSIMVGSHEPSFTAFVKSLCDAKSLTDVDIGTTRFDIAALLGCPLRRFVAELAPAVQLPPHCDAATTLETLSLTASARELVAFLSTATSWPRLSVLVAKTQYDEKSQLPGGIQTSAIQLQALQNATLERVPPAVATAVLHGAPNLQHLFLRQCQLPLENEASLADLVVRGGCKELFQLSVKQCNLHQSTLQAFASVHTLQYVEMSDPVAPATVRTLLLGLPLLEELECERGVEGPAPVDGLTATLNHLETLSLQSADDNTLTGLAFPSLTSLHLGAASSVSNLTAIAQHAPALNELKVHSLPNLFAHRTLSKLSVELVHFGSVDFAKLVASLPGCKQLRLLSCWGLQWNSLVQLASVRHEALSTFELHYWSDANLQLSDVATVRTMLRNWPNLRALKLPDISRLDRSSQQEIRRLMDERAKSLK